MYNCWPTGGVFSLSQRRGRDYGQSASVAWLPTVFDRVPCRFRDCRGRDSATNADWSLPRLGVRTVCGCGLLADMERVRRCHVQGLFKPANVPRLWPPAKHIARSVADCAAMDSRTQKPCKYKGKRVPCLTHDEKHIASFVPALRSASPQVVQQRA